MSAPAALRRAIMERYAKRLKVRDEALANAEAWEALKAMAFAPSMYAKTVETVFPVLPTHPRKDAMYRQGDIAIIPVEKVPANAIPVDRDEHGRIVLAEGEITGHFHCVLDDPATLFREADMDEMADRFLRVEQEVQVVHDEHDPVTLPPGDYRVRRQREHAPEAPKYVAD